MSVWQRTGKQPAALADGPALPPGCGQLWADFLELHATRARDMNGPMPISFRDMADWQGFHGVKLAPWEVDAIRRADNAYMARR